MERSAPTFCFHAFDLNRILLPKAAICPARTARLKLAQFALDTPAGCFCHSFLWENAAGKK
jgi:hypothetical protein